MRKLLLIIGTLFFTSLIVKSQAPEKISYQAILRDASNNLIANKTVSMQISILQGSVNGTASYIETHKPTTNLNGLISIEIGFGTPVSGTLGSINWINGPYFIKTETDPLGGSSYTITGASQLMSVPYALYAKSSGSSTPGPAGLNSLVKTTIEAAGVNCTTGGIKMEYGIDVNNNQILESGEVNGSVTKFICNGALGTSGKNSLTNTTQEVIGENCNSGGIKVEYGIDANANNLLDPNEIDQTLTKFICNGNPGKNALMNTIIEAAGLNCTDGGIKLEVGLDTNSNGILEANEVNTAQTKFICNSSAMGIASPTVTTDAVSNITSSSVTLGGHVSFTSSSAIVAKGVIVSAVDPIPNRSSGYYVSGPGTGVFTINATNNFDNNGDGKIDNNDIIFQPNTTYYVRAYVSTENEVVFLGNVVTFQLK